MRKKEKDFPNLSEEEKILYKLEDILGDKYKITSEWYIKHRKFKFVAKVKGIIHEVDLNNDEVELEINEDYEDELDPKFEKFEEETGMEIVKTVTKRDYK